MEENESITGEEVWLRGILHVKRKHEYGVRMRQREREGEGGVGGGTTPALLRYYSLIHFFLFKSNKLESIKRMTNGPMGDC